MKESQLHIKSYDFALQIVRTTSEIQKNYKEYVLTKQLLRSGTAIGALIKEAQFAQSKADFINKLNIGLKEANETKYWLHLIKDSAIFAIENVNFLIDNCAELISMLVASLKTLRNFQPNRV